MSRVGLNELFEESNHIVQREFIPNSFQLIEINDSLIKIIDEICCSSTKIGIDTEQSFQKTYKPFLCLVQISTESNTYIIDVLSFEKSFLASQLKKVLSNPNIIKVFYAGSNDLLWLKRDLNLIVLNIFDIQLAAQFLDSKSDSSLVGLIDKYHSFKFEKTIKKQLQVSEWSQRPLSEEQLNYSALDSHFLISLRYLLLKQSLEQLGQKRTIEFIRKVQSLSCKEYNEKPFDDAHAFSEFNRLINSYQNSVCKQSIEQNFLIKRKILEKGSQNWKIACILFANLQKIRDEFAKISNLNVQKVSPDSELLEEILHRMSLLEPNQTFIHITNQKFIEEKGKQMEEQLKLMNDDRESLITSYESTLTKQQKQKNTFLEKQQKKNDRYSLMFSMKKVAYENCQILSPDGDQLCNCDEKKINWYLKKGLATRVQENPSIIKLNFEPSGKGNFFLEEKAEFEKNYRYVTQRENKCVVCGSEGQFAKFYVVPSLYRKHFPEMLKSHRSQDILLLCMDCHSVADDYSEQLIEEICQKSKIKKVTLDDSTILKDAIIRLSKYAESYLKNKHKMPEKSKQKFKSQLMSQFKSISKLKGSENTPDFMNEEFFTETGGQVKVNKLFYEFISQIAEKYSLDAVLSCSDSKNLHGKLIVSSLKNLEEITEFVLMWRNHFISKMKPKHLPSDWKSKKSEDTV